MREEGEEEEKQSEEEREEDVAVKIPCKSTSFMANIRRKHDSRSIQRADSSVSLVNKTKSGRNYHKQQQHKPGQNYLKQQNVRRQLREKQKQRIALRRQYVESQ